MLLWITVIIAIITPTIREYDIERLDCVVGSADAMRFRTLSRRLAAVVGVAGGGSLLAAIAFSKQPSHDVRISRTLFVVFEDSNQR